MDLKKMKTSSQTQKWQKTISLKRAVHKKHKCIAEHNDDLLPTFIFTSHRSPWENVIKIRVYLEVSTTLKLNNLAPMILLKLPSGKWCFLSL